MTMINHTNACGKNGSMLVNLSSMFVNGIIIKVAAEICMRGMEVWTQGLRSSNHGKAGNF